MAVLEGLALELQYGLDNASLTEIGFILEVDGAWVLVDTMVSGAGANWTIVGGSISYTPDISYENVTGSNQSVTRAAVIEDQDLGNSVAQLNLDEAGYTKFVFPPENITGSPVTLVPSQVIVFNNITLAFNG